MIAFALFLVARPDVQVVQDARVWANPSRGGRVPVSRDAVQAGIVAGEWSPPTSDGAGWHTIHANKDGWFESNELDNGYADVQVKSDAHKVVVLTAPGCTCVYVDGVIRTGDPYQYGYVKIPVVLEKGDNDLLFACARGRLRVQLEAPTSTTFLNLDDATLPDVVAGDNRPVWAAVVVENTTEATQSNLAIAVTAAGGTRTISPPFSLPPLSLRKLPVRIDPPPGSKPGELKATVTLMNRIDTADKRSMTLRIRDPKQTRKVTFVSSIDGSVQYYALNPCTESGSGKSLILTLHGASVEAIGQADAYAPKSWANLVAPTNRRPYGFDWEDWGRADAMEVLQLAKDTYKPDPFHIYLTGHSMGGHGTWTVGATYPDRFAAIAPSAGWASFFSYVGTPRTKPTTPIEDVLYRAVASSDTMLMAPNYAHEAVYILHGDKDDNVPVTEARNMRDALAKFHPDLHYHEQPGAGHWWGSPCVDWPGIMDLFQARSLKPLKAISNVDFVTVNPAVSATCDWATIERQTLPMAVSRIQLARTVDGLRGTTENVQSLTLLREAFAGSSRLATIELDGKTLKAPVGAVSLERYGSKWGIVELSAPNQKTPLRGGPFKQAFNLRPVFIYATHGSDEENRQSFAKARFDAEALWYRGNSSIDVVSDTDYLKGDFRGRNAILYGNADTNSTWRRLLADSPIVVRRDRITVGSKVFSGPDLACLFLRPMPKSPRCLVGVVAGTGLPGLRLAERLPYFTSGVQYPDWIVIGTDALTKGTAGVRDCGFFSNSWR